MHASWVGSVPSAPPSTRFRSATRARSRGHLALPAPPLRGGPMSDEAPIERPYVTGDRVVLTAPPSGEAPSPWSAAALRLCGGTTEPSRANGPPGWRPRGRDGELVHSVSTR